MRSSRPAGVRVGVLALQGNVSEHIEAFCCAIERAGITGRTEVLEVKSPGELAGCDALAIPGGESTTISRLIDKNHLRSPLRDFKGGVFGTCAGMVLMATSVADARISTLGLIDMHVDRNAFGRQKDSFEADICLEGIGGGPYHAIFIRAPVATSAAPYVRVLGRIEQGIVAVEYGRHMAFSFHPELGTDTRLHEHFLRLQRLSGRDNT